ncbi:dihydrodipicolinate synthase family protein, partial [Candidatus Omnitrophota bacterium]
NFYGIIPPISTLYRSDGEIDVGSMRDLFGSVLPYVHGLFVGGSAGNLPNLSPEEVGSLTKIAREVIDASEKKNALVLAGARGGNVDTVLGYVRAAHVAGADACVIPAPEYKVMQSEEGDPVEKDHLKYFEEILDRTAAEGIHIPIIPYNIPMLCGGVNISFKVMKELKKHPRVIGIKDSSSDREIFTQYAGLQNEGFKVFQGFATSEGTLIETGAAGIVPICGNIRALGPFFREYWKAVEAGDKERLKDLQVRLKRFHDVAFSDESREGYAYLSSALPLVIQLLDGIGEGIVPKGQAELSTPVRERIENQLIPLVRDELYGEFSSIDSYSETGEAAVTGITYIGEDGKVGTTLLIGPDGTAPVFKFADVKAIRDRYEEGTPLRDGEGLIAAGVKRVQILLGEHDEEPASIEELIEMAREGRMPALVALEIRGAWFSALGPLHRLRPGWTFKGWEKARSAIEEKFSTEEPEIKEALHLAGQFVRELAVRNYKKRAPSGVREVDAFDTEAILTKLVPHAVESARNFLEFKLFMRLGMHIAKQEKYYYRRPMQLGYIINAVVNFEAEVYIEEEAEVYIEELESVCMRIIDDIILSSLLDYTKYLTAENIRQALEFQRNYGGFVARGEIIAEQKEITIKPLTSLSILKITPVLFLGTDILSYPVSSFAQALEQLRLNEGNIPVILSTKETEKLIREKLGSIDISLKGVEFRTPEELGLQIDELDEAMSLIVGIDNLRCIPLTDALTDAYGALKNAKGV